MTLQKEERSMNPQVLGTEYLIYVAISLLVAFATCFLLKNMQKRKSKRIWS